MKKLDKKGFMLAEVIIVSAIMIGVMVSMYVSFNRLYNAYDERSRYYDIDGVYAMKNIEDILIDDLNLNYYLFRAEKFEDVYLIKNSVCSTLYSFSNCEELKNHYKIYNLYLYNKNDFEDIKDMSDSTETLKDYIKYLSNSITFENQENNIMIIEIKKADQNNDKDYYYSYLKIK